MGELARDHIEKNYSLNNQVIETLPVYRTCCRLYDILSRIRDDTPSIIENNFKGKKFSKFSIPVDYDIEDVYKELLGCLKPV